MKPELIFYLFIFIIIANYLFSRILERLNTRARKAPIPPEGKGIYDDEKYKTAQQYHDELDRFGVLESGFSVLATLTFFFLDGFSWLDQLVRSFTDSPLLVSLIFFLVLAIASDLIGIPFDIYSTFVIEEKYGFNKTTTKTFIADKIKGYLLMIILGGIILTALIYFYEYTGEYFWLLSWGIVAFFLFFFTLFYTSLILPLFNKLSPLPEGELRSSIEEYCNKNGFALKNIFVMDGSKRSSKANAFFSGFGAKKTIVLYDTLIEKHTVEELVAVLAHEVGHYKLKHTVYGLITGLLQTGITLFLLSLFIGSRELANALGVAEASFHIGIIAFSILYSPVSLFTGILWNMVSRKNEYEADAFAKRTYNGEALQSALKKLSVDQLSNLTPHPAYVFVHYSHPPLLARLAELGGGAIKA